MRQFLCAISYGVVLAFAPAIHAETSISAGDLKQAEQLGATYRRCLQQALGLQATSTFEGVAERAPAAEQHCASQLSPIRHFLSARGYATALIEDTLIDIKAKADGATIGAAHRLPPYRY